MLASVAVLSIGLVSCSSLNSESGNSSRYLSVEKKWAKDTLTAPYLFSQVLHRMKPIAAGHMLFVGNSLDGLIAYEKATGNILWRKSIKGGVESGAVLHSGHLYFGAGDGFFYKVKALDGKTVWSFPIQAEGLGLPTIKNGKVYFMAGNSVAHCVDAETGKAVWRYKRGRSSYLSVRGGSRPLVVGPAAYYGFSDGYFVALDSDKGTLIWEKRLNRNKKFKDIDAEPILSGNLMLISSYDGDLVALDKGSGQVRWRAKFGGHSRPVVKDSVIYVSSSNNQVAALDKDSGRTIWVHDTRSLSTMPQLYAGLIVFGEYTGSLKFLDSETGKLIKEFFPGRGIHSQIEIDPEAKRFYFMSSEANLFALDVDWKKHSHKWPWEKYEGN